MERSPAITRFQYGLAIFVLTALIGLATELFGELDLNTLLAHLRSGRSGGPIMGLAELVGIATFPQRLQPEPQQMRAPAPA